MRDKIAIIVDDGVATGLTLKLAIAATKTKQPKQIIVAVPVVAQQTADAIAKTVDALVALEIPTDFRGAVGAYYEQFAQTTDAEVVDLLNKINVSV